MLTRIFSVSLSVLVATMLFALILPGLAQTKVSAQVRKKGILPSSPSSATPAIIVIGIIDNARLGKVRADYPSFENRVIPDITKSKHLSAVITKDGLLFGKAELPTVDITDDVILALSKDGSLPPLPLSPVASSPAQDAPNLPVVPSPAAGSEPAGKNKSAPVSLVVVSKSFHQATFEDDDVHSDVNVSCKFTNNSTQDIRATDGVIDFDDLFGHLIETVHITLSKPIPAGQTITWDGSIDYNEFMDKDVKLRNTDLQDMKINFSVNSVIYADGTSVTF